MNLPQDPAERVIALVDVMRENSSDNRMWKNIPLAKECIELLKAIDDPEETPMGKALACRAICNQLPEYNVPRLVLGILHYERELLEQSDEVGENNNPTLDEVDYDIRRLSDYIDTGHLSTAEFIERYQRFLNFDPVERTPQWEEGFCEVEEECDRRLGDMPRGMGFCFAYWSTLSQVLAERGIQWRSPSEMNPGVIFD